MTYRHPYTTTFYNGYTLISVIIVKMTYLYLLMFASLDRIIFPEAQDVISAIIGL